MSKILVLSGSRADFAYLLPVAQALREAGEDAYIESLANVIGGEDTPEAIAQRAGMILSAGGKTIADAKPDLMVVLGDRWEIASACIAAVLAGVPIAQLAAGERTAGAYDDKFRLAIEGMATIKFAFCKEALERLDGDFWLAGCTSVKAPEFVYHSNGEAIVALYPETAGEIPDGLLHSIIPLLEKHGLSPVVIGANPDVGSSHYPGIEMAHEDFHDKLWRASLIIGNSSAGLIEAPILGTPTVDIGNRQSGRPRAESVFWANAFDLRTIDHAITKALAFGKQSVKSPYYNERAIEIIVDGCRELLRS